MGRMSIMNIKDNNKLEELTIKSDELKRGFDIIHADDVEETIIAIATTAEGNQLVCTQKNEYHYNGLIDKELVKTTSNLYLTQDKNKYTKILVPIMKDGKNYGERLK